MDIDRNIDNSNLFIFGIVCLVISIALLFFCLYILPFLIWNLNYSIADFVIYLISFFQDTYNYTEAGSRLLVWFIFFIPCLIAGILSYFVSRHIDKEVLGITEENSEEEDEEKKLRTLQIKQDLKESASLGFKIFFLMICIVAILLLLQIII